MARTLVRPTDLALGTAGALADDGTQSLAVRVDGVTISVNGSNQLVAGSTGGGIASSTLLNTTAPLAGGGLLSSGLTLSLPLATSTANGYLSSTDWTTFNSKQSTGSFLAGSTAIATTFPLAGGGALSTGLGLSVLSVNSTGTGYLNFNSTVTMNSRFLETPVPLLSSSAVTVDTSIGNTFTLLASTNFTLQAINGVDGVVSRFRVKQNSTGGWAITLGSTFNFGTDLVSSTVTISSTANKTSYIAAMYNSTSGLFDVMGNLKGF